MRKGQVASGGQRAASGRVALAILALLSGLATGQDDAHIRAELRVAAIGIVDSHHTLWLRTGPGREPLKTRLNTRTFSPPIDYKGPAVAQFFATAAAARAEEPAEPPLARLRLQAGSSLVVFLPAGDPDPAYRTFATHAGAFPYGSYQFANFSHSAILVQGGDKTRPVRLDPGKSRVFSFARDQRIVTVRIAANRPGEPARLIRQTNFSISPEWREMVFFFDQPETTRVRMRHLVDAKPEPPAE